MKKKLITTIALAGTFVAGSISGWAQSSAPAPTPASRGDGSTGTSPSLPAPTLPPSGKDRTIPPGSTPSPLPADGARVVPISLLLPDGSVSSDGKFVPSPPPGTGDRGSISPANPTVPIAPDQKSPRVSLVGSPPTLLPAGPSTPSLPIIQTDRKAAGSGAVVVAGDIVRTLPPEGTPYVGTGSPTPVLTLVQQFDAQRNQELTARATALEQLRTATPDQRTAIIAELQATAQRQAVEQREAARELRSELRALREERKGK